MINTTVDAVARLITPWAWVDPDDEDYAIQRSLDRKASQRILDSLNINA